jgi:hypothetical protein
MDCLSAMALLAAAAPDSTKAAATSADGMSAWAPVLAIGEPPKAIESAVAKTARLAELARAAYLHRKLDADTQRLVDGVASKLQTLEPKGLYDLLGEVGRTDGDVHSFEVFGRMHPKGDYLVVARGPPPVPSFSSMRGELAVRPARPDRYLVTTDVALRLDLDATDVTQFWRGVAEWLEREAQSGGARHGLDAADEAVLGSLDVSFPKLGALVTRYIGAKDVVASTPVLWLYLHPTFDTARFAADYPGLASGFGAGGAGGGGMRARLRLTGGERLFAFAKMDTVTGTRIAVKPDLIRIPEGDYRFVTEVELDFAGLEMSITDLRVDLFIRREAGAATFEYRLDHVPTIRVSGAIMDLISVELIDTLIPSQMETIIRDFYETLATGDGGKGASWKLTLPANEGEPMRIQTRFELLDNGFVSFWLRAGSGMFSRSEDARRDLLALTDAVLTAFDADFDRLQAALIPSG